MNKSIKINLMRDFLAQHRIVILGFGREGRSSYYFIRKLLPAIDLAIADANTAIREEVDIVGDNHLIFHLGNTYLDEIERYDLVIKSPGISLMHYKKISGQQITSQTDLFLKYFGSQCVGITGTKGKSTTASLIQHILKSFYKQVLLIGNIGVPALDVASDIDENTMVVFELSSHQLEYVNHAPHIAVLLNLYQEHLDHYKDYKSYRWAKWNIAKYQLPQDYLILPAEEAQVSTDIGSHNIRSRFLNFGMEQKADIQYDFMKNAFITSSGFIPFDKDRFSLLGQHNINNLMAALLVCNSLKIPMELALQQAYGFSALAHRLELVAEVDGAVFYNDSIATIPEATIKALESVPSVQTLILGGFDRGIDYTLLVDFLLQYSPLTLLLLGEVGLRLHKMLKEKSYSGQLLYYDDFDSAIAKAMQLTKPAKACLLSPAAASYDKFKNFEERGERFKTIIRAGK